MFEFITQHEFGIAVAVYWIYSAAVSSLPDPASNGSPVYQWLYRFLHTIAGNLTTAFGSRIPGLKVLGLGLLVPLLFSASACAAHYKIHPGALSKTDSAAYDALLIAETIIDQARCVGGPSASEEAAKRCTELTRTVGPTLNDQAGQLLAQSKQALDALIRSYNVARASWLTYHNALPANKSSAIDFDQLTKNLADLMNAIRAFKEAK
jgi:hypothetical protein